MFERSRPSLVKYTNNNKKKGQKKKVTMTVFAWAAVQQLSSPILGGEKEKPRQGWDFPPLFFQAKQSKAYIKEH